MAARLDRPFETWREGLLALCDALEDAEREKIIASRLAATMARHGVIPHEICCLALTVPCAAQFEEEFFEPITHPMIEKAKELGEKLSSVSGVMEEILNARERISEFVLKSFARTDPRRLLNDTVLGLPAAALADLSARLGESDPFLRLARRLCLYFRPFTEFSRYGLAYPASGQATRSTVTHAVEQFRQDDRATVGELLKIWTGKVAIERSPDAITRIRVLMGDFPSADSIRLVAIEVYCSLMEQLIKEYADDGLWYDDLFTALSTTLNSLNSWDDGRPATADLRTWIEKSQKFQLVFDPSPIFSAARFCDELDALSPLLETTLNAIQKHGHAIFPTGPLQFDSPVFDRQGLVFSTLLGNAPDAAEMIRLLAQDHGDWPDTGLYRDSWAGDGNLHAISVSEAVDNARNRGDLALCDMLIGCWLLYCAQFMHEPLPDHVGLGNRINSLPIEHRGTIIAVLSELRRLASNESLLRRDLDALLSWLQPVPLLPTEDLEAEMRQAFSPELWDFLSDREQTQLQESEREIRELRKLGSKEANKRMLRLASLVSSWSAIAEKLLFRAVCNIDKTKISLSGEKRALGNLVRTMFELIKASKKERWDWKDGRRGGLIGWDVNEVLGNLNKKNVESGKHIGSGASITWEEVLQLRSNLYYGGVFKTLMNAARGTPM